MYAYSCASTLTQVVVTNYNPTRNACYKVLERAACVISDKLWHLPEATDLPGGFVPNVIGISLHSETDIAAVNWRGLPVRGDHAFPLLTPSCSARPGLACIQRATPRGTFWDVVVCSDLAAHEAGKRNIPYREELVRYAIHALLHLAGEGDHESESAERMFRRQEALIETALRHRPHRAGRMDQPLS